MEGWELVGYNPRFEIQISKSMRILVCDGLEKAGVDRLRSASGVTVDERPSIDGNELAETIGS